MAFAEKFHRSIIIFANIALILLATLALLIIGKQQIKPIVNKVDSQFLISKLNKSCQKTSDYPCYKKEFVSLIKNSGIKPVLVALASLNNSNQVVRQYCHSLAHDLGRTAYDLTDGDFGQIFTKGDTTCWSGFFHGALEKAFKNSTNLAKTARSICTTKHKVVGSFLTYQCLHGLGHGLSARFDNEIFSALHVCEALETSYEQNSCFGGVFMENYVADGINHQTRYTDVTDTLAPCNKVADKYKFNCYQLVSIQILKVNGYDFASAFKTCQRADSAYVEICYQSVGRDIAGYTAENYDQALADCSLGNETAERICVMAVATDSVYSRSSPNNAQIICSKTKLNLKAACYEAAGASIAVLYDERNKKIAACNLYDSSYQITCKVAAGVN